MFQQKLTGTRALAESQTGGLRRSARRVTPRNKENLGTFRRCSSVSNVVRCRVGRQRGVQRGRFERLSGMKCHGVQEALRRGRADRALLSASELKML